MTFLLGLLYSIAAFGLALFSLNYFVTILLYLRRRTDSQPTPALAVYPAVTVQLPVYNELYVAERLVDAVAALDWPRERLQIQVLDDSDDETAQLLKNRVEYYSAQGIEISHVRRDNRQGYKAGALAAGFERASGEFIAVFDADFVPPPNFLHRTLPHFQDSQVGMVQARWGHVNATASPLTRAQAMALDGHFMIEQTARARSGLFLNFNGAAGVWRHTCIAHSGGWQSDTLTEDLDLSYRAQLAGWKFIFLPEVVAPAEVPPQIQAFKRQQFRWAKGSTQCLLKLGPRVLTAPGASWFKRFEGLLHLSGYLMNLLMLVFLLTLVPLIATGVHPPTLFMFFSATVFGPPTLFWLAQHALYPDWLHRFAYFPVLALLGVGLSWSNSLAVLDALLGRENTFHRTPKFRIESEQDSWEGKRYSLAFSWQTLGEFVLALYAVFGAWVAYSQGALWAIPALLVYAVGLSYVAVLTLWHSRPHHHPATELAPA